MEVSLLEVDVVGHSGLSGMEARQVERLLAALVITTPGYAPFFLPAVFGFAGGASTAAADRIAIRIDYTTRGHGLVATLAGPVVPLTTLGLLEACLRRPFGSRRVLALIHWQALKLWLKEIPVYTRPEPPAGLIHTRRAA